ncbi:MAG: complex I NDUFA9 subunit family protein [bacterium]
MQIFLTGGTGFVGSWILKELLNAGHRVRVLVRPNSPAGPGALPAGAEAARADVLDPSLEKHLEGVDCVVHLVGIIRDNPAKGVTFQKLHVDATRNVLRAMQAAGRKRLLHMSALGAGAGDTPYFRTKYEAEHLVKDSGLDWTVFKPSVIYGPGDEFVNMLARQVRLLPVVPVMGDGEYRLQPVSVQNVAEGFVKSASMPETIGKVYEVGGPHEFTYNRLLDEIAQALGKSRARKVHLPLGLMVPMIKLLQRFQSFPLTHDQLKMLLMNNVCDPEPFFQAFGVRAQHFREDISQYLK